MDNIFSKNTYKNSFTPNFEFLTPTTVKHNHGPEGQTPDTGKYRTEQTTTVPQFHSSTKWRV